MRAANLFYEESPLMPMFFGKVIGTLLGFAVYGWFGALLGLLVGHWFDRGLASVAGAARPAASAQLQRLFFDAVFTLMGRLAKVDGRISAEEIREAERIITQLGLSEQHRSEAIVLFRRGAEPEFIIEETLLPFARACGGQPQLIELLLSFLVLIAYADGELVDTEIELLKQVANTLGLDPRAFSEWLGMSRAQSQFHGGHFRSGREGSGRQGWGEQGGGGAQSVDPLASAYAALGVSEAATDAEVKKAYRRLMSQYHPDKLIAQGVPDDMIKLGTEKAQEIQAAYDLIAKSRKRS